MKILVAGLGIIGGSACMSLKRAGYAVDGWNRSPEPLRYALERGAIDRAARSFTDYDLVFVVLPPEATAEFLDRSVFKEGAVVSDMCGVKGWMEERVYAKPRAYRYVGCHPMAGKEVSGIANACATLFDNASMIITRSERTDPAALEILRAVVADMGFGRIVECSAQVHDRKIAYTSQLAHLVSNAYVKDAELSNCLGFTGGSFQDMTRIAGVDEVMWASLYLKNAPALCKSLDGLISSLSDLRAAVAAGDRVALEELLGVGRARFESCKNICGNDEIFVKKLR